ncbi:hypothetical protein BS17DRAFT_784676 [Gyrodon lividus]|nr:hypothetical protein BS17DRAFT_784676 [Gyrodon lividus]
MLGGATSWVSRFSPRPEAHSASENRLDRFDGYEGTGKRENGFERASTYLQVMEVNMLSP